MNQQPSVFEKAFGKYRNLFKPTNINKNEQEYIRLDLSNWKNVLSHRLPSVSKLCSSIFEQLL